MKENTSTFDVQGSSVRYSLNDQLPLDPPVLMGFFDGPAALAPGLAMNLEPPIILPLAFLLPGFPLFLLFTGNDICIDLWVNIKMVR